jgi:hypothetical protein
MTRNHDTAKELRDAALLVLKASGKFKITDDGVCLYIYDDKQIRIGYQPAIAGTSMPSFIDIWLTTGAVKVFCVYCFGTDRFDVEVHQPGPWEAALLELASGEPRPALVRPQTLGHDLTNGGLGCPVRAFKLAITPPGGAAPATQARIPQTVSTAGRVDRCR